MTEREERFEDHPDYEPAPEFFDEDEDEQDESVPPEPAEGDDAEDRPAGR